jgi:hypothetical protein
MRADMKKVIVERPRYNRGASNNKSAKRLTSGEIAAAMADEESFDSPRSIQRNRDKSFNEHLGPLRRFLRRNVGRPWNKVYSEIREVIDTRSTISQHVLDHLKWEVQTETFEQDRKVYAYTYWGCAPVRGFYIHPRTNLLSWAGRPAYKQPEAPIERVALSEKAEYQKIDGLWYRIEYRPAATEEDRNDPRYSKTWKRVLVAKRQCDRKTIQQIEDHIRYGALLG